MTINLTEITNLKKQIEILESIIAGERLENAKKISLFTNDLCNTLQLVVNMIYSLENLNLSGVQMDRLERGNDALELLVRKIHIFKDFYDQISIPAWMQERQERELNNLEHLQGVEEVVGELSDKPKLEA
ncbi:MAG: hypothetical protein Q7T74_06915 [Candidatus Saccharibacteria bacterium]|nr:hypothetical protein [Candidatus Saccharibacteria bacterium]